LFEEGTSERRTNQIEPAEPQTIAELCVVTGHPTGTIIIIVYWQIVLYWH